MINKYDPFIKGLSQWNQTITDKQIEQFDLFYQLLIEKNKVMNLTAITDFNEVLIKHFLDSVALGKFFSFDNINTVIDLGTGAGFPGIPLKIMYPNLHFTLVDSLNKRILFLNEVIEKLELKNIIAVHGRAEELAKKSDMREQYDLCVSRAVANISTLSEYCIPFVKKDGYFVSYKAGQIQDELESGKKSIDVLGGKIHQIEKFSLPDSDYQRSFVIINKTKNTPKKYPRKPGTPSKEPIS